MSLFLELLVDSQVSKMLNICRHFCQSLLKYISLFTFVYLMPAKSVSPGLDFVSWFPHRFHVCGRFYTVSTWIPRRNLQLFWNPFVASESFQWRVQRLPLRTFLCDRWKFSGIQNPSSRCRLKKWQQNQHGKNHQKIKSNRKRQELNQKRQIFKENKIMEFFKK